MEPTLDLNLKPSISILIRNKGYLSSDIKDKLKEKSTTLVYPYKIYKKSTKINKNGLKKHNKSYKENTDIEKNLFKIGG